MLCAGASSAAPASMRASQAPGASPSASAAPPAARTGQHAGAARQDVAPLRACAAPAVGGCAPTGGRAAAHGHVPDCAAAGAAPASCPAHAAGGARGRAAAFAVGPASGRGERQGAAAGAGSGTGSAGALGGTGRATQGSAPAASAAATAFRDALRRLAQGSAPAAVTCARSGDGPGSAARAGAGPGSAPDTAGAQFSNALRNVGSPLRAARHPAETAPGLLQALHDASGDAGPERVSAATLRRPAAAAAAMLGQRAAGGGGALREGERPGSDSCSFPSEGQGQGLSAQPCAADSSAARPAGSCDPDLQPGGCSRMCTGADSDGAGAAAGDASAPAAHASAVSAREHDSGAAREGPEREGAAPARHRRTVDSDAGRGLAPGMHHPSALPYYEQVQTHPSARVSALQTKPARSFLKKFACASLLHEPCCSWKALVWPQT